MNISTINIDKIEKLTQDILRQVYIVENDIIPPIKLSKILEFHGFTIKSGEFPSNTISGAADIKNKIIYISDQDSFPRQAFTIAHEFAHYILKNGSDRDIYYRTNLLNIDSEDQQNEIEANAFAASLLMPSELVIKYWKDVQDVSKMALWFGVTKSACYWRINNLKLK